jgi:hypothetical protein
LKPEANSLQDPISKSIMHKNRARRVAQGLVHLPSKPSKVLSSKKKKKHITLKLKSDKDITKKKTIN